MLDTETARTINTADGIYENLNLLLEDITNIANELAKKTEVKDDSTTKEVVKNDSIKEPELNYVAEVPKCPKCGKSMTRRTVKKGKNIGDLFWGCTDFPKCKGTLTITENESDKEIDIDKNPTEVPSCPVCENSMILRTIKKGEDAGKKFWGCSQYPKCRGNISI